jgi:prepilin-type N-terminal cleavage/methylation domain-containing protein
MQTQAPQNVPPRSSKAFTLVELLVVIAIISILMTAGVIGLNGMGGKGVTSGVATAESVFDEARTTAIGRNIRSCVLVSKDLTNNRTEDLRRLLVAYEEVDPVTGLAKDPANADPKWVLSSRAVLLPDQTFFSQKFSRKNHETGGNVDELPSSKIAGVKAAYAGTYYLYRFNAQGICETPGASFVIGSGVRNATQPGSAEPPRVTASAKKDFGGFVVWRNGGTSVFRSPDQMGSEVKNIKSGDKF